MHNPPEREGVPRPVSRLARFLSARFVALVDVNQFTNQKDKADNNACNNDGPTEVGHRKSPQMTNNGLIFADRYPVMTGFAVTGFLRARRRGDPCTDATAIN
jgi:hypothetical protein